MSPAIHPPFPRKVRFGSTKYSPNRPTFSNVLSCEKDVLTGSDGFSPVTEVTVVELVLDVARSPDALMPKSPAQSRQKTSPPYCQCAAFARVDVATAVVMLLVVVLVTEENSGVSRLSL